MLTYNVLMAPQPQPKRRTPVGTHRPVMVEPVMRWLDPKPGEVAVDCTLGYGGHAEALLARLGPAGRLIGLDVDASQLATTAARLAGSPTPLSVHAANFSSLADVLAGEHLDAVDVILADLGVSSMQVDDPQRGISYAHEGPLDMRMDPKLTRTGADLLASLSEADLSAALRELSHEGDHQRIAQFVVAQRQADPIRTTGQLVRLVLSAKNLTKHSWQRQASYFDPHPAARTFQALRILVNDELGHLQRLLEQAPRLLKPGGRIGIISFQPGEDSLVKRWFARHQASGLYAAISGRPTQPTPREQRANPRSASALFRWAKRSDKPAGELP